MIRALLAFALSRRAVILLGLFVFIAAGLIAYSKLNIEAYPNPAPVILEITAQAAGPVGRGDGKVLHDADGDRALFDARASTISARPHSTACRSSGSPSSTAWTSFFAYTQAALSLQQNVNLPGNQVAQIQQSSLVGEVYPLSGRRSAAFRADQSAHRPGLGRHCAVCRPFPAWCRSTVGAARPRNSTSMPISENFKPTTSRSRSC
jgi:hypothetical protein